MKLRWIGRRAAAGWMAWLAVGAWVAGAAAEESGLSEARFEELRAALVPTPDEPWQQIPWKVGLLEAQREAAQARQPIFIWAMDGHPLGCT